MKKKTNVNILFKFFVPLLPFNFFFFTFIFSRHYFARETCTHTHTHKFNLIDICRQMQDARAYCFCLGNWSTGRLLCIGVYKYSHIDSSHDIWFFFLSLSVQFDKLKHAYIIPSRNLVQDGPTPPFSFYFIDMSVK